MSKTYNHLRSVVAAEMLRKRAIARRARIQLARDANGLAFFSLINALDCEPTDKPSVREHVRRVLQQED